MSVEADARERGYIIAKLEEIERRISSIDEKQTFGHTRLSAEVQALKTEVRDYTSQWKAVRWIGGAAIGLVVFLKTGSFDLLKAVFGAPP